MKEKIIIGLIAVSIFIVCGFITLSVYFTIKHDREIEQTKVNVQTIADFINKSIQAQGQSSAPATSSEVKK